MARARDHRYYVEGILDERTSSDSGKKEYLLRWRDFQDATWESADKMAGCSQIVSQYLNRKQSNTQQPIENSGGYVERPSNPPSQRIVTKVDVYKIWQDKPLYLVQYADEYASIKTRQELEREVPSESIIGYLEGIYISLFEKLDI